MSKLEIPNFIHCSITGHRFAVRRDVMLVRIKDAGSLERLQLTYVSRDARRLLKEGKSIEQIREELGYEPATANQNLVLTVARSSSSMARVRTQEGDHVDTFWRGAGWEVPKDWNRRPMSIAQIQETTKDQCLYPPYKLDKDCPGCPVYEHCTLFTKGFYKK